MYSPTLLKHIRLVTALFLSFFCRGFLSCNVTTGQGYYVTLSKKFYAHMSANGVVVYAEDLLLEIISCVLEFSLDVQHAMCNCLRYYVFRFSQRCFLFRFEKS